MTEYRIEKDLLGEREIPADVLYGVHTLRGIENFPLSRRPVNAALIHAFGAVKLACARTNHGLGWWDDAKADAIEQACSEMMAGKFDEHISGRCSAGWGRDLHQYECQRGPGQPGLELLELSAWRL